MNLRFHLFLIASQLLIGLIKKIISKKLSHDQKFVIQRFKSFRIFYFLRSEFIT
jgi:hypothetical protein